MSTSFFFYKKIDDFSEKYAHLTNKLVIGVIEEAAEFLGAHKETVRRLAVTGILPGAKIGRGWMFIEQDLVTHMRNKYSTCDASQGVHNRSHEIWHSKEKTVIGGLTSHTAENVYEKALKLK